MINIIKDLYKINRPLVGAGYDSSLEYINHLIDLNIIEIPSGTECWTWTVPQAWEVKDAWVKFNGKKILNYKKKPLCLSAGSVPFSGTMDLAELKKHLYYDVEKPKVTQYVHGYYDKKWGFSIPHKKFEKLKEGEYEVLVDTKLTDGTLKIGEHIIKGKSNREIWVIIHLDHPFQANDGLSQVAMAIDLSKKLKCNHTVKILFVPETIGSIAYVHKFGTENLDFVITADMVGNDNTLCINKSFNNNDKLNKAAQLALSGQGTTFRIAPWRAPLGADEYIFGDPFINKPAILFHRYPYKEYHTSDDTPDIIIEEKLEETRDIIMKTIEIMEKDYIPVRNFKGPLMRSKFKVQSIMKETNRQLDFLIYGIDGERSLIELSFICALDFDTTYNLLEKLHEKNLCSRASQIGQQEA